MPLKKKPSRSCISTAEGTHLPVLIFYLSRVYSHLLGSHYYVWLNNCSHWNYIQFNLVITWVSEAASTSSLYSFQAWWNYLMLQIQMSVEGIWEYWENPKTLKSQLDIFRIILCKRCFLLSHLSMSVGEGWQPSLFSLLLKKCVSLKKIWYTSSGEIKQVIFIKTTLDK